MSNAFIANRRNVVTPPTNTILLRIVEFMKTQSIHLPFLGHPPAMLEPRRAATWACHLTQSMVLSCARCLVQCGLAL